MGRFGGRNIQAFNPAAASGASTQVMYFAEESGRAMIARSLNLIGINPASTDADTLSVVVDYSTDGSAFTAVGTVAAAEYNDTDNTLALVALVPNEKIADGSFTTARIPGGALVRIRQIWAGTVGDGQVATSFSYDIV